MSGTLAGKYRRVVVCLRDMGGDGGKVIHIQHVSGNTWAEAVDKERKIAGHLASGNLYLDSKGRCFITTTNALVMGPQTAALLTQDD